jgi:hypothetical protein
MISDKASERSKPWERTVAPYRSNKGPPKRVPEKRKKPCNDPIQAIDEGLLFLS